jgi:hypothetical protein
MTEQEKDMLRKIPSLRIEAQSMLKLISNECISNCLVPTLPSSAVFLKH